MPAGKDRGISVIFGFRAMKGGIEVGAPYHSIVISLRRSSTRLAVAEERKRLRAPRMSSQSPTGVRANRITMLSQ